MIHEYIMWFFIVVGGIVIAGGALLFFAILITDLLGCDCTDSNDII